MCATVTLGFLNLYRLYIIGTVEHLVRCTNSSRTDQEAPDWWYVALFVITTAMGLATCLAYDSQLPWWTYFVSIILALVFVIPTCTVLAISNIALALNVLSPFLAGFMIPGRPIGVMIFKGE
jgi:hypothetical protein